jgi:hypothetical protein
MSRDVVCFCGHTRGLHRSISPAGSVKSKHPNCYKCGCVKWRKFVEVKHDDSKIEEGK